MYSLVLKVFCDDDIIMYNILKCVRYWCAGAKGYYEEASFGIQATWTFRGEIKDC